LQTLKAKNSVVSHLGVVTLFLRNKLPVKLNDQNKIK
jgi:hypothetical protein